MPKLRVLESGNGLVISANTKNIYDEYIRPLSREQRLVLLNLLQAELYNGEDKDHHHNILELRGLGKEIWQGVDANEYVSTLREEFIR
jgi:hypothetical protein